MNPDLNFALPVNNLTTLASDYNWVEEMALLTRHGLPDALRIWQTRIEIACEVRF